MTRKFFSGPFILILPSILAIGFVIIIPLIFSFYTSFTSYKLTRPDSLFNFVGLRNYERLIDNAKFWYAFGRTILFLAVAIAICMHLTAPSPDGATISYPSEVAP